MTCSNGCPLAQDMDILTASVDKVLTAMASWGYLIAGHGLYAWGRDINEARRHLEAFVRLNPWDHRCRSLAYHGNRKDRLS